jgi:hypothetical protein
LPLGEIRDENSMARWPDYTFWVSPAVGFALGLHLEQSQDAPPYACATPVPTRDHIYLIKSSLLPSGVVGGTPTGDVYVCAWVLCMMRACVSYQYAMQPSYLESARGDLPPKVSIPPPLLSPPPWLSNPLHAVMETSEVAARARVDHGRITNTITTLLRSAHSPPKHLADGVDIASLL